MENLPSSIIFVTDLTGEARSSRRCADLVGRDEWDVDWAISTEKDDADEEERIGCGGIDRNAGAGAGREGEWTGAGRRAKLAREGGE
eukprot:765990-Hanusia_phi.AAC.4